MNSRHPYTYAADFIRTLAGYGEGGTKLSRSDASQIRQGIAKAIGMNDHELACRLSEAFQAGELDAIAQRDIEQFIASRSTA